MSDGRDYRVEGNDTSGYIGVSPEYMTYANETEKPLLTSQEEWDYTHNLDHLEGNLDEPEESEESEVVEDKGNGESKMTEGESDGEGESKKVEQKNPVHVAPVVTPVVNR